MHKNTQLAFQIVAIVAGMLCLAYASVPLYNLWCKATGYNGTPKQVQEESRILGTRTVTVRFNTDIDPHLPWDFYPLQDQVMVKTGETALVYFEAVNRSSLPMTASATFNITPDKVAQYFNKIQCFCFSKQTLQPGQKVKMPVSFFVDPAIEKDLNAQDVSVITLSYTFFASP